MLHRPNKKVGMCSLFSALSQNYAFEIARMIESFKAK